MEILEAIRTRRSIRKYKEEPVSKEIVEQLLENAILAPSASNMQPWAFVVIQDAELLKSYSDKAKALYLKAMADHPDPHSYKHLLSNPKFNIFYDAGTLIIIYNKSHGTLRAGDCSLAAQNLMLSAHALGLGTCWIGFSLLLLNDAEFKQKLGIPEEYKAIAPLILGYPDEVPSPTSRNPVEIVAWKS